MTALAGLLASIAILGGFTLDASGSGAVTLAMVPDSARAAFAHIGVLERYMPGVEGITAHPDGSFRYCTVREIPFSGEMRTEFHLRRTVDASGSVSYQSPDSTAANWMRFRFTFTPAGEGMTEVRMTLRVRLMRDSGTEIHILAPVLGEEFLSERMESDITDMLATFATRLEDAVPAQLAGRGGDAR